MQIVALGTEIIECVRIAKLIERHGEAFLRKAFTDLELSHCQNQSRSVTENFTALWAGKLAILKTLGLQKNQKITWIEMEIDTEKQAQPLVSMMGSLREQMSLCAIHEILLTTAFCRHYATATAIAVRHRSAE